MCDFDLHRAPIYLRYILFNRKEFIERKTESHRFLLGERDFPVNEHSQKRKEIHFIKKKHKGMFVWWKVGWKR